MEFFYLLLALYVLYTFYHKENVRFLFAYMALITSFFGLDLPNSAFRPSDICIAINVCIGLYACNRRSLIEKTIIDKLVLFTLCFYLFEFVVTLISGAESFVNAVLVLRIPLFLLGYYAFREITVEEYHIFFRKGYKIFIVWGILYYLQFAGVRALAGSNIDSYTDSSFSFALNTPIFIYLYILYILVDKSISDICRYVMYAFAFGMIVMQHVRTTIIATLLGTALLVFIRRDTKLFYMIIICFSCMLPLSVKAINEKSTLSNKSSGDDIVNVIQNVNQYEKINPNKGTFSFRIALLGERLHYLSKNPEYLLTGVGMVHELSPSCYKRFHFKIGTRNKVAYYGRCMIESGDITWAPVLLRYGIFGVALSLFTFLALMKANARRRDGFEILFPLAVVYFLNSFSSSFFEHVSSLYILVICLAISRQGYINKITKVN